MTVFWFITTAICFVGWIHAEVQWRLCKRGWSLAIQLKDVIREDRDKAQKERDELRRGLKRVKGELDFFKVRYSEARMEYRCTRDELLDAGYKP